jgi:transcriptional regulator with XRE-family HTH domain
MTAPRFGAVLRRLRKAGHLTQAQLARRARLNQGYISQLESGMRANPSATLVKKLARALEVPVTDLMP